MLEGEKINSNDLSNKEEYCSLYNAGVKKVSIHSFVIAQISKEDILLKDSTRKGGILLGTKENEIIEISEACSKFHNQDESFSPDNETEKKIRWGIYSYGEHPDENDVEVLEDLFQKPFLLLKYTSLDDSPLILLFECVFDKEKAKMRFFELCVTDHCSPVFSVRVNALLSECVCDMDHTTETSLRQKIMKMYQSFEGFNKALDSKQPCFNQTLEELRQQFSAQKNMFLDNNLNYGKYIRRIAKEENFPIFMDYWILNKNWLCFWWLSPQNCMTGGGKDAEKAYIQMIGGGLTFWFEKKISSGEAFCFKLESEDDYLQFFNSLLKCFTQFEKFAEKKINTRLSKM